VRFSGGFSEISKFGNAKSLPFRRYQKLDYSFLKERIFGKRV